MDAESSQRLNMLRFPLIVGVVFVHAYGTDLGFAGGTLGVGETDAVTHFIRNFISQGVARTAVPLFFLMSGYFFFVEFSWSITNYVNKLATRVQTLLIPFLIWNIVTLVVTVVAQSLPATQSYFSGKNALVASFDFVDYISAIFGIGRMPIAYQFWFIRDLMVLALLAPAIHFFLVRLPLFFIAGVTICWLTGVWPLFVPSSEATLFFAIGGMVAIKGKNLFALDDCIRFIVVAYLLVLSADVLLIHTQWHRYLYKVGIVLGVLSMLCVSKIILRHARLKEVLLGLASASFFVFAAHEPLLTIFRKIVFKLILPDSSFVILVLYFLIPILLIMLLVSAYQFGARRFTWLTRVITGGRCAGVAGNYVADGARR